MLRSATEQGSLRSFFSTHTIFQNATQACMLVYFAVTSAALGLGISNVHHNWQIGLASDTQMILAFVLVIIAALAYAGILHRL